MSGNYELQHFSFRKNVSPLSVFQKLVTDGSIKFNFGIASLDLKSDDLRRIHSIIHEIDDRRAFYTAYEDELPEYMLASIKSTKMAISNTFKEGLWTNQWARQVAQIVLHELGEFVTVVERTKIPKNHHDKNFDIFEQQAMELRLKIWTAVAHYVVVFGSAVQPLHLPHEILTAVQEEYDLSKK